VLDTKLKAVLHAPDHLKTNQPVIDKNVHPRLENTQIGIQVKRNIPGPLLSFVRHKHGLSAAQDKGLMKDAHPDPVPFQVLQYFYLKAITPVDIPDRLYQPGVVVMFPMRKIQPGHIHAVLCHV
jgi:hypothetical protein